MDEKFIRIDNMINEDINKQYLARLINNNNPFIIEIGCYDGKDTKELLETFVSPIIYVFEADPRSQDLFKRNVKLNKNIILEPYAVCHKNGLIPWYSSNSDTRGQYVSEGIYSASSTIKKPKNTLRLFPDIFYQQRSEVLAIRLDDWKKQHIEVNIIDLAWIDVNGAEEEILFGGLSTFQNYVKFIYMEFSDFELFEHQITQIDILTKLSNFDKLGIYSFKGNFGNLLLKNRTL